MLKVQRLNAEAHLPTRTSPGAAGYDLYSSEDVVIKVQKLLIFLYFKIVSYFVSFITCIV